MKNFNHPFNPAIEIKPPAAAAAEHTHPHHRCRVCVGCHHDFPAGYGVSSQQHYCAAFDGNKEKIDPALAKLFCEVFLRHAECETCTFGEIELNVSGSGDLHDAAEAKGGRSGVDFLGSLLPAVVASGDASVELTRCCRHAAAAVGDMSYMYGGINTRAADVGA
ncbi:hypothetical protein Droror1_Dr00027097 [Drosera rotundifolia]